MLSFLRDVRIGYRLGWAFSLILLLMIGIALIATTAGRQPRSELASVITEANRKLAYVSEMRKHLYREGISGRRLALAIGFEEATEDMRAVESERNSYTEALDAFLALP